MSVATSFAALTLASALLTITPGMDTALIIRTATAVGRKEAIKATLGCHTGCLLWGIAASLGLGALVSVSEMAFDVVKYAGAAYLLWLGVKMLLSPKRTLMTDIQRTEEHNWYLKGMTGNLLNPKIGIFYVSLPAQVLPEGQSLAIWTFGLAIVHVIIAFPWALIIIHAIQSLSRYLQRPSFLRWMDRVTGSLFVLFALKLATSRR